MKTYQLTITTSRHIQTLAQTTAILAREKINIRAITFSSHPPQTTINLLVDNLKRAEEALFEAGLPVERREVLAVLTKDQPGGLDKLMRILEREQIVLKSACGFSAESRIDAVFVMEVAEPEIVRSLLKREKFLLLSVESLCEIEPVHSC